MFPTISGISIALILTTLLSATPARAAEGYPSAQTAPDELRLRMGSGDPIAGKDKAAPCTGCHGEDGNSADSLTPKLAGQYGEYISKQMRNYLSSTRSHQTMSSMAAAASDADLPDIGAYFASQPLMKGAGPSGNKLGKQLYENDNLAKMRVRCSSCHGTSGKGLAPANPVYPVIGGQHKDYLLAQLKSFKKGLRNNSHGGVMNITMQGLSDADLEALADYMSGL